MVPIQFGTLKPDVSGDLSLTVYLPVHFRQVRGGDDDFQWTEPELVK